jgi:hypothetical protein
MTIHLDFVTTKKTALRFTLSSIYQLLRSAGTVLRVPLRLVRCPQRSGLVKDHCANWILPPCSLDARWTVVVVDLVRLLELHAFNQYARESYRHLKVRVAVKQEIRGEKLTFPACQTLTLCASMNVRNVFVSPVLYTPTVRYVRLAWRREYH